MLKIALTGIGNWFSRSSASSMYNDIVILIIAITLLGCIFVLVLSAITFKNFDKVIKKDESAHLVNWVEFFANKHYRENNVLKSNELDAKCMADWASYIWIPGFTKTQSKTIIENHINYLENKRQKAIRSIGLVDLAATLETMEKEQINIVNLCHDHDFTKK